MKKNFAEILFVIAMISIIFAVSCTKRSNVSTLGSLPVTAPTIAPSPTITPVPVEITDFEDQLMDGWQQNGFCNNGQAYGISDWDKNLVIPFNGHYMWEFDVCTFSSNNPWTVCTFYNNETSTPNFQGKSLIAHVWIPASLTQSAYELDVYFTNNGSGNTYAQIWPLSQAVPYAWNTYVFTLATNAQNSNEYSDESGVGQWGVDIRQNGGAALPLGDNVLFDYMLVE